MKKFLRSLLINGGALWITSALVPGFVMTGGIRGLAISTIAFMIINVLLVPLIKILLLPLNLLTVGIFAWLTNVLALYFLVAIVPSVKILPFVYPGANWGGFIVPEISLTTFMVTIVVSLVIGLITHFIYWLIH